MIDAAARTGCSDFNKVEFLAALTSIREQAFKETAVLSAFRQTGSIPFNPEIMLSQLSESTSSPRPIYQTPILGTSDWHQAYRLVTSHTYQHC